MSLTRGMASPLYNPGGDALLRCVYRFNLSIDTFCSLPTCKVQDQSTGAVGDRNQYLPAGQPQVELPLYTVIV